MRELLSTATDAIAVGTAGFGCLVRGDFERLLGATATLDAVGVGFVDLVAGAVLAVGVSVGRCERGVAPVAAGPTAAGD